MHTTRCEYISNTVGVYAGKGSGMSVKVLIPTPLRALSQGASQVLLDDHGTITHVLASLEERFPGFHNRIYDDAGQVRRFINIYVNGEDIRFLAGGETPVATRDEISIVPAVAGGDCT